MRYFEWLGELESVEIRFPDRQFNGSWMVEGVPVIGWHEHMVAVYLCQDPPVFDFGLARNSWPVFSSRMRFFLETIAPEAVQYLSFRFQRPDGSGQDTNHYVGQILHVIDCLDRRRTKVRKDWDPINAFGDFDTFWPSDVALSRPLIGNAQIFRIKGHCRSIVVSEEIKLAIENAAFPTQRFDLVLSDG